MLERFAQGRMSRLRWFSAVLAVILVLGVAGFLGWRYGTYALKARNGAGAEAPDVEEVELEARAERAEKQSILFSDRIAALEEELAKARSCPPPLAALGERVDALAKAVGELQASFAAQREEASQRQAAAESFRGESAAALAELKTKAAELDGIKAQLAQLAALGAQLGELAPLKAEVAAVREEHAKTAAELAALSQRFGELSSSLESASGEFRKLLEEQATAQAERRERIDQLGQNVERLAALLSETVLSIQAVETRLAKPPGGTRREERAAVPAGPAPALGTEAAVRACDEEKGVAILSVGAAGGVEVGQQFDVSRDGRRIGTVRVVRLWESYSGAEIVEILPGEKVRTNDTVRRKLPPVLPASSKETPAGGAEAPSGASGRRPPAIAPRDDRVPPPPPPPGG